MFIINIPSLPQFLNSPETSHLIKAEKLQRCVMYKSYQDLQTSSNSPEGPSESNHTYQMAWFSWNKATATAFSKNTDGKKWKLHSSLIIAYKLKFLHNMEKLGPVPSYSSVFFVLAIRMYINLQRSCSSVEKEFLYHCQGKKQNEYNFQVNVKHSSGIWGN